MDDVRIIERIKELPLFLLKGKNEDAAIEICKLLIERRMNYIDMNEALYLADKALHHLTLRIPFKSIDSVD